jgi:uncharacterized damage-inducible protein DinB
MTEGERIAEQHRRAYHGEAWHGPSVFELLEDVNAARAAARPISAAHSIWEIVLHLTSWESIVRSRLVGDPMNVTADLDWPKPAAASPAAWDQAKAALHEASEGLRVVIARMTDAKLLEIRPGTQSTYYDLVHGQVQHSLYHAGQMAVLAKGRVSSARPAAPRRSKPGRRTAPRPGSKAPKRKAAKKKGRPTRTSGGTQRKGRGKKR